MRLTLASCRWNGAGRKTAGGDTGVRVVGATPPHLAPACTRAGGAQAAQGLEKASLRLCLAQGRTMRVSG